MRNYGRNSRKSWPVNPKIHSCLICFTRLRKSKRRLLVKNCFKKHCSVDKNELFIQILKIFVNVSFCILSVWKHGHTTRQAWRTGKLAHLCDALLSLTREVVGNFVTSKYAIKRMTIWCARVGDPQRIEKWRKEEERESSMEEGFLAVVTTSV